MVKTSPPEKLFLSALHHQAMKRSLAIFLLLASCSVFGQPSNITVIPFVLEGEYITLPVYLNDAKLLFIFDTGATATVLDSATAARLNIAPNASTSAQGASGTANYKVCSLPAIRIHDVELKNVNAIHVPLNKLSSSFGKEINGIVGNDILMHYVVEIDYDEQVLKLHSNASSASAVYGQKIPFSFINFIPIPAIEVEVELQNGKRFSNKYLVDSGAGTTLIFNTPFARDNNLHNQVGKTITSSTKDLTSKSITHKALIKSVRLSEYTFSDVPVLISEATKGVNAMVGFGGILGNEVLKRFNWLMDYRNKILYLKPNRLYNSKFTHAISGFKFERVAEKIIVTEVNEESDAYAKGIRKGFEILKFGDYEGRDFEKIRSMLQVEGPIVLIGRDADGVQKIVEINLKRLL